MNREKISATLRALRGDRTREEVAIACSVTANAISMYETGARVPSDEIKIRLAKFFGKTVQEIFYEP
mgnify:CR=1 FL=1